MGDHKHHDKGKGHHHHKSSSKKHHDKDKSSKKHHKHHKSGKDAEHRARMAAAHDHADNPHMYVLDSDDSPLPSMTQASSEELARFPAEEPILVFDDSPAQQQQQQQHQGSNYYPYQTADASNSVAADYSKVNQASPYTVQQPHPTLNQQTGYTANVAGYHHQRDDAYPPAPAPTSPQAYTTASAYGDDYYTHDEKGNPIPGRHPGMVPQSYFTRSAAAAAAAEQQDQQIPHWGPPAEDFEAADRRGHGRRRRGDRDRRVEEDGEMVMVRKGGREHWVWVERR